MDYDPLSQYLLAVRAVHAAQARLRCLEMIGEQRGFGLANTYSSGLGFDPTETLELSPEDTWLGGLSCSESEPVDLPPLIDYSMDVEKGVGAALDRVDKGKGKAVDKARGKEKGKERGKPYFRQRPPLHMKYESTDPDTYLAGRPSLFTDDAMAELLAVFRGRSAMVGGFSGDPSGSGVPHHDD